MESRKFVVLVVVIAVIILVIFLAVRYERKHIHKIIHNNEKEKIKERIDKIHHQVNLPKKYLPRVTGIKTNVHQQYIDLTWNKVEGASTYKILYWDNLEIESASKSFGPFNHNFVTLSGIPPGKYQFAIEAEADITTEADRTNALGNSLSDTQEITIEKSEILLKDITLSAIDKHTMRIEWVAEIVPPPQKFKIYVNIDTPAKADSSDYQIIEIDNSAVRSHILYDLDSSSRWFVKVAQL